jgi:hypothetical protein
MLRRPAGLEQAGLEQAGLEQAGLEYRPSSLDRRRRRLVAAFETANDDTSLFPQPTASRFDARERHRGGSGVRRASEIGQGGVTDWPRSGLTSPNPDGVRTHERGACASNDDRVCIS